MNGTLGCFCNREFDQYNALILFTQYRADGLDQDEAKLEKWKSE